MKEDIRATVAEPVPTIERKGGPQGIGMAVAFDWGLAVQTLVMSFVAFIMHVSGPFPTIVQNALLNALITTLISLPFAFLIALFGEGVRRGWRWTRPIQIVFNAVLIIGGIFTVINLIQASQHGNYWSLVTAVILVIFSPLIVWRLSRPQTARWFASVSSQEARKRHGGMWPVYIALWAIAGGVLQSIAALSR